MEIKNKTPKKTAKKTVNVDQQEPKRISKTWEAVLKLEGTGKILDMRAVLK